MLREVAKAAAFVLLETGLAAAGAPPSVLIGAGLLLLAVLYWSHLRSLAWRLRRDHPVLFIAGAALFGAVIFAYAAWRIGPGAHRPTERRLVSAEIAPFVVTLARQYPDGKRWTEYGLVAIVRAVNSGDTARYVHSLKLRGRVSADQQTYVTAARMRGLSNEDAQREFQRRKPFRVIEWDCSPAAGTATLPPGGAEQFVLFRLVSFGEKVSISSFTRSETGEIVMAFAQAGEDHLYFGFRDTEHLPVLKTTVPRLIDVLMYSEPGADIIRRPTFRPDLGTGDLAFVLEMESESIQIEARHIRRLRSLPRGEPAATDLRDVFFGLGQFSTIDPVPVIRDDASR